ncbi:MAG TPA: T9SS type A sorting domain-containing protein [Cytophagaceae bacterium]
MRRLLFLYIFASISLLETSAQPYLVKDLNTGTLSDLRPKSFVNFKSKIFFTIGNSIWSSDGTLAGTTKVTTIHSVKEDIAQLHVFKNLLVFIAEDWKNGKELWTSDGSSAGTKLLKDIAPGQYNGILFEELYFTQDKFFFQANDGVQGWEVWVSDATTEGTKITKDINPNQFGETPSEFELLGDNIFFRAYNDTNGWEVWRSNGTPAGTYMVKDINPTGSSYPYDIRACNGTLYFTADDGQSGKEVWKSDGTEGGTSLLKDMTPGSTGKTYSDFFSFNDKVFFLQGYKLFVTDGKDAVQMVHTFQNSTNSSADIKFSVVNNNLLVCGPNSWRDSWYSYNAVNNSLEFLADANNGVRVDNPFLAIEDVLYFKGYTPSTGEELFKTEGTVGSTRLVKDIIPGATGSEIVSLTAFLSKAVVTLKTNQLWISDGSILGTNLLRSFRQTIRQPSDFVKLGEQMLFTTKSDLGFEAIWQTKGTTEMTNLVREMSVPAGSTLVDGVNIGNKFYFKSDTTLYKSDGSEEGTIIVNNNFKNSNSLVAASNKIFFSKGRDYREKVLSVFDINSKAIDSIDFLEYPAPGVSFNGWYYYLKHDRFGIAKLCRSDGTPKGTSVVKELTNGYYSRMTLVGNQLIFVSNGSLWKSDGTPDGTELIKDLGPISLLTEIVENNGLLYIGGRNENSYDYELWQVNVTSKAAKLIKSIKYRLLWDSKLVFSAGKLFFVLYGEGAGAQLWSVWDDLENAGLLLDIPLLESPIRNILDLNGTLYYSKSGENNTTELWKTQGMVSNSSLVKTFDDNISDFISANGYIYFKGFSPNGYELWKSDGTPNGTLELYDINTGAESSNPNNFYRVNDILYFIGDNGQNGAELMALDLSKEVNGVSDKIINNSIRLYPNPTAGQIVIHLDHSENTRLTFEDLTGITRLTIDAASGERMIDLSGLPKGVYVLKLQNSNGTIIKKIIYQ